MKNIKSFGTIGIVILGMVGLLFLLAKMATKTPEAPQSLKTSVSVQDHIKGKENAPITLVEYSDFECPACKMVQPNLKRLSEEFDDELKIVYRHFPLRSIHKNAEMAAYASEAANLQGKFWEYHDVLFNTQEAWENEADPKDKFTEYAKSLGMNEEQFKKDMNSSEVKNRVKKDVASAEAENLKGTPSFFLNGMPLEIPRTYEGFSAAVVEQIILTGNNEIATSTTK